MALPQWQCRMGSQDIHVVDEVLQSNTYRLPRRMAGIVAIDIGCHIGAATAAFLERGVLHVYAYEPHPENYRLARQHLAHYGDRVTLVNRAVVRSDEPPALVYMPRTFGRFRGYSATGGLNTLPAPQREDDVACPTIAFDAIIDQARQEYPQAPLWLKLDGEGVEWPALLTSRRLHEISQIVAEGHCQPEPLMIDGVAVPCTRQTLATWMAEAGWDVEILEYSPCDAHIFRFFAAPAVPEESPHGRARVTG